MPRTATTAKSILTCQVTGCFPVTALLDLPTIATAQAIDIPEDANVIQVQCNAQGLRFKWNTNPTSALGLRVLAPGANNITGWTWIIIPSHAYTWNIIETAATCTGHYQFWRFENFPPFSMG